LTHINTDLAAGNIDEDDEVEILDDALLARQTIAKKVVENEPDS